MNRMNENKPIEERPESRTFFAQVSRGPEDEIWTTGIVLDAYPNERWHYLRDWEKQKRSRHRLNSRILGEFATYEEAFMVVGRCLGMAPGSMKKKLEQLKQASRASK